MSPLGAFLNARLDETEHADWHVYDCDAMPFDDGYCCDADRWLARDIKAKRAIVALHDQPCGTVRYELNGPEVPMGCKTCGGFPKRPAGMCPTLLALGAVYADHPDYRPEWGLERGKPPAGTGWSWRAVPSRRAAPLSQRGREVVMMFVLAANLLLISPGLAVTCRVAADRSASMTGLSDPAP